MAWMLSRLFFRKKHMQAIRKSGTYMNLKRAGRALVYLFNLHTLMLLAASCIAIYICAENGWSFNMDFSMISTGTVFPLTFTLAQAFTRRERATALIASIKASAIALYYMHRDWDQTNGYPSSLGNDELPSAVAAKTVLMELLISIRRYLVAPSTFESIAEARLTADKHEFLSLFEHDLHLSEKTKLFRSTVRTLLQQEEGQVHLRDCYKWLSRLSVLNEKLTLTAGYTRGGEGGLSRTNQYLRYIASAIEELRSIKEYRTPTMMRHACGVLFHIFAVVLAPYFVHYCTDPEQECAAGYASASAYVMIVMLLFHVQQDLENCFSETGLDDAFFHVAEEVDGLTGSNLLRSARSSMSDITQWVHGHTPARFSSMELPNTALGAAGGSGGGGSPPCEMIASAFASQANCSFSHDKLPTLRTIPEAGKVHEGHDADEHTPLTKPRSSDGGGGGGSSSTGMGIGAGWGRPTLYTTTHQQPSNGGGGGGGCFYLGSSPNSKSRLSGAWQHQNSTPSAAWAAGQLGKQSSVSPPAGSPAGSGCLAAAAASAAVVDAGHGSSSKGGTTTPVSPDLQLVASETPAVNGERGGAETPHDMNRGGTPVAGRPATPSHCVITCPPTALGVPANGSSIGGDSTGTSRQGTPVANGHCLHVWRPALADSGDSSHASLAAEGVNGVLGSSSGGGASRGAPNGDGTPKVDVGGV